MATHTHIRTTVAAVLTLAATILTPVHQQTAHGQTNAQGRQVTVPILMYHRIDSLRPGLPAMTRRLTVDPHDFERQMIWLKGHGFHTLTQRELYDAMLGERALPDNPVVITFDDGYRDVWGKASPVLARLGLHAIAYVISGRISGPDPSFLTWSQLRGLEQRGIEIGSHTVSHADLPSLTDSQALAELVESKRALERGVGHPIPWLAYPYGAYDARIVQLARRAGYQLAVTTDSGACQNKSQPLELRRLEVLDSTGVTGLRGLLDDRC